MLGWKGEDVSPESDGSIEKFVLNNSDKKISPNDGAHVKREYPFFHLNNKINEIHVQFMNDGFYFPFLNIFSSFNWKTRRQSVRGT